MNHLWIFINKNIFYLIMVNKKRKSIKKARIVSKKRYKKLLHKKRTKRRMSKKEKEQLDHALFINYCKCIKSLKYSKKYEEGLEYPICISSVYKNREIKPPKDLKEKCRKYY